ncbi:MAG: hypothetical protein J6A83_01810 [Clostridia bacterium]|nr:hypothetical protein [Clostridia bacterium]
MNRFPIGFWNYTSGELSAKDVKDWSALGMTMACSPTIDENTDKETIIGILDACAENDIKVIMCDNRTRFKNASDSPEEYRARSIAAYEDFGKHPAVFGFFIGDEPEKGKDFPDAVVAHNIQLEVAPELTPFLNFLPYWEGQEETILKAPSFLDWAANMIKDANLKVLSYDCYTQLSPEMEKDAHLKLHGFDNDTKLNPEEEGLHMYFRNLRLYREAADRAGIIPWTTLLSVGHWRYRCPNEDDLRWQLSTAVASGMEGIMWFHIYERECRLNYRLAPIDAFGEHTETFNWLARTNKYFLHQFGDFFNRAKWIKTIHYGKAYGEFELWEKGKSDDLVMDISSPHNLNAVVGFFELDGKKYVAIVNNSPTETGMFRIHVSKKAKNVLQWNWHSNLVRGKYTQATDNEYICGDWYAPGQMKLYCIET